MYYKSRHFRQALSLFTKSEKNLSTKFWIVYDPEFYNRIFGKGFWSKVPAPEPPGFYNVKMISIIQT